LFLITLQILFEIHAKYSKNPTTVYGLDGLGLIPGARFSILHSFQTGSGAHQPPIQWVLAALSTGIKRPGVKLATHLHLMPRTRMVSYNSNSLYVFIEYCLIS
jgi:hypothetical protein